MPFSGTPVLLRVRPIEPAAGAAGHDVVRWHVAPRLPSVAPGGRLQLAHRPLHAVQQADVLNRHSQLIGQSLSREKVSFTERIQFVTLDIQNPQNIVSNLDRNSQL